MRSATAQPPSAAASATARPTAIHRRLGRSRPSGRPLIIRRCRRSCRTTGASAAVVLAPGACRSGAARGRRGGRRRAACATRGRGSRPSSPPSSCASASAWAWGGAAPAARRRARATARRSSPASSPRSRRRGGGGRVLGHGGGVRAQDGGGRERGEEHRGGDDGEDGGDRTVGHTPAGHSSGGPWPTGSDPSASARRRGGSRTWCVSRDSPCASPETVILTPARRLRSKRPIRVSVLLRRCQARDQRLAGQLRPLQRTVIVALRGARTENSEILAPLDGQRAAHAHDRERADDAAVARGLLQDLAAGRHRRGRDLEGRRRRGRGRGRRRRRRRPSGTTGSGPASAPEWAVAQRGATVRRGRREPLGAAARCPDSAVSRRCRRRGSRRCSDRRRRIGSCSCSGRAGAGSTGPGARVRRAGEPLPAGPRALRARSSCRRVAVRRVPTRIGLPLIVPGELTCGWLCAPASPPAQP